MLRIIAGDGSHVDVAVALAQESNVLKGLLEDLNVDLTVTTGKLPALPVQRVPNSAILRTLFGFIERHHAGEAPSAILGDVCPSFDVLLQTACASDYLDIPALYAAATQAIAKDHFAGKTDAQLRALFHCEDAPVSNQERQCVLSQHPWLADQ